jgi:hypothetical protein
VTKEQAWAKLKELAEAAGPGPTGMLCTGPQPYKLFIDDERNPPDDSWTVVRTVAEAKEIITSWDLPTQMSLDHDLGGDETVMQILRWMAENYYEEGPPSWQIHSANPVGRANMASYLKSWTKSLGLGDSEMSMDCAAGPVIETKTPRKTAEELLARIHANKDFPFLLAGLRRDLGEIQEYGSDDTSMRDLFADLVSLLRDD